MADLVQQLRERLVYFRQLSYILGSVSLIVTVLLVATLLAITVNERLGEIATLRAIGVSRRSVVGQVVAEGTALTALGAGLGVGLGLVTARYLDAILTSFPGLPAAISFFVPDARALAIAATVLLAAGALAGLYPAWLAARAPIAATLRVGGDVSLIIGTDIRRDYAMNGQPVHALRGVNLDDRRRRVRRHRRAVRVRQIHAAPHPRRHRSAVVGPGEHRGSPARPALRSRAHPAPPHPAGLRLPALPSAAGADRARERRAADGGGGRQPK